MTVFEVWAPEAGRVEVETGEDGARHLMGPVEGRPGWWAAKVPEAGHGTDYGFVLDGGEVLPDPRSRWQPHGVHGRSRVYEHDRFPWHDQGWHGRPLPGGVLYELHVGTFTPEGTFDAAVGRLDHLVELGVDFVELLPVAAFPGRHGWGYDGVDLWAVHEPYGGPDGLKRFVDACHAKGLAVVLDVVYNHLGPSGNYLGNYGPYFTPAHQTPWGQAVNFDQADSDEVRTFVIENALAWLRDFHLDGLRLDAVHAIADGRAVHLLEELSARVDALAAHLGRELVLIAESDLNDPRLVTPREAGGHGLDAQWSDDFHHALHAALTGERQGYYCDFGPLAVLAKALTEVFVHDGAWSTFRGRRHGRPVDRLRTPAHRFLGYLQNHDQIGNRATGDRLPAGLDAGLLKVGAALVLTAPFTPMLFMGEEWGAATPWCYFTDHTEPELARAVTEGRRREFARHGWGAGEVPDPQAVETFRSSVLDWAEPGRPPHRELLAWHRDLIALRRRLPDLTDPRLTEVAVEYDEAARWLVLRRGTVYVAASFGSGKTVAPVSGDLLLASDPGIAVDAGSVTLPGASVAILAAAPGPAPR
ncbi:maltooligosyl trehalose hydrolase [Thermomonospora echinospora]|uniref:Malto-oligosyltrehalose trehalohydrolase n=1 Tax=Thermomonospora echinospora TaxID=1992 RepID=A0A1H6DZP1_9ACTN|nr:malto-oligosyltrehalose trehalohydrolase [Thermomonospora echinospora]SEG90810.1 maltooligosyl trehalose hydrolase [Thermomonospora echinospora]